MPSPTSAARPAGRRALAAALAALTTVLTVLAVPTAGAREPAERPRLRLERIDVVDHNVQLRPSAVQAALDRAASTDATLVLLQEVCSSEVRRIRAAHPDWTVAYQRSVDAPQCRARDLTGLPDLGRRDSGLVAIWTGGSTGVVTSHVFRHQGTRRGTRGAEGRFRDGVVCVSWAARGVVRRGCSTHLVNASRLPTRRGTQFRQAREVRRLTRPWVRRGDVVVVGGDFNASPQSRPMDLMYRVDGDGAFHEATGCPRAVEVCRRALGTTFDGGRIKIDYVFFSANRMAVSSPRRLAVLPTLERPPPAERLGLRRHRAVVSPPCAAPWW